MNHIVLEEITKDNIDYDILYQWTQKKIVYEWFEQRVLSYEEIEEKYQKKLNSPTTMMYIDINHKRIGYLQYYSSEYKEKAMEYDLWIGEEEYLSKGIGQQVIDTINNELWNKYPDFSIILRPFKRNIRACKCYEKCGFQKVKEYLGEDTLGKKEVYVVYEKRRG